VGKLNTTDKLVEWQSEEAIFGSGKSPHVALNNHGIVVVVYVRGTFRKDLFGLVGDVDSSNGVICWRGREEGLMRDCKRASVSLNDHNNITIGFTCTSYSSFLLGQVNREQDHVPRKRSRPASGSAQHSPAQVVPEQSPAAVSKSSSAIVIKHVGERHNCNEVAVGLNNHGHLLSIYVIDKRILFFNGRLDHTHTLTEKTLRKSEQSLKNIAHLPRSCAVALNSRNLVVFTCDISHGFLNRKKVVFTVLGNLVPSH
jgi:hypothetical protein